MKNYFLIIIFLVTFSINGFSQGKSKEQKELIEVANKYFKDGDFKQAMPLYSQLLSIYPTEAIYSYHYGACLVENNKEIHKAIKYLAYGAKKLSNEPLVFYYLGSAYHLDYQFDKAISQYENFQDKANAKQKKNKDIERIRWSNRPFNKVVETTHTLRPTLHTLSGPTSRHINQSLPKSAISNL